MLIIGLARDVESVWPATAKSLQIIFDAVPDYHCIIIESNSTDNTLKVLNEWAKSRTTIVSLGNLNIPSRTIRIAHCRNKYMEIIQSHLDHEYTLILDLDCSLEVEPDFKQQLETCFQRSDWDAVASNRRGKYYDIWALRSNQLGVTFDCWEKIKKHPYVLGPRGFTYVKNPLDTYVYDYQRVISPDHPWIFCESAFGGMVLYKTISIKNRRYDGSSTCEHVSFNQGLKMFINPAFISGGNCWEHIKK